MVGNSYKIKKRKQRNILDNINEGRSIHQQAADYHAGRVREATKKFWNAVREFFPEMDFDNFEWTYDSERQEFLCQGRTPKGEIEKRLREFDEEKV